MGEIHLALQEDEPAKPIAESSAKQKEQYAKGLKLEVSDDFMVHLTLNTLSPDFSQIKTAYNTQNQTWSVNDLISKCDAQEKKLESEKKLKRYLDHSKGYKFYCPACGIRIIESMIAKFLKFDVANVDCSPQLIEDVQNKIVSLFLLILREKIVKVPVERESEIQEGVVDNLVIVDNPR
ncbi:hypothetical protein GH714_008882 [Hevea brasiliensis]|uniref:Uncharacterized protein n=1 Tax=Hevea brasiliensis TaxID=3981 RepID=A0A6A6KAS4_HEVBR|nr:hypothetical protein GH714_008882 [Hevea brasiliensis]